ncbi:MAG: PDZ domain-containing protein [Phycisphaeraceae bacterium]|nr:PDZ domain-containing protein [Phycisphaeraceae bacterium]
MKQASTFTAAMILGIVGSAAAYPKIECEAGARNSGVDNVASAVIRVADPHESSGMFTSYYQPLNAAQAASVSKDGAKSKAMLMVTQNDQVIKVEVVGDALTAWVNGVRLPEDRIRRDGESVVLLRNDDGEMYRFRVFQNASGDPWIGIGSVQATGGSPPVTPPKVMLGIHMSEPDDKLLAHLGFSEGTGVQIEKVIEGAPAASGGLAAGDIIVTVNGVEGVTVDSFRSQIADRSPGDVLRLGVIRKGKRIDVNVTLAPYDAKLLGVTPQSVFGAPSTGAWMTDRAYVTPRVPRTEEFQQLLTELQMQRDGTVTLHKEQVERLRELARQMYDLEGRFVAPRSGGLGGSVPYTGDMTVFRFPGVEQRELYLAPVPRGGMAPRVPSPPETPRLMTPRSSDDALTQRMERLEAKLDRLEKLLERLEKSR